MLTTLWTQELLTMVIIISLIVGLLTYMIAVTRFKYRLALYRQQSEQEQQQAQQLLNTTVTERDNIAATLQTLHIEQAQWQKDSQQAALLHGKLEERVQAQEQRWEQQQQAHHTRLQEVSTELQDYKEQCQQQQQLAATASKQARAEEVRAEEVEKKYQDSKQQLATLQQKYDAAANNFTQLSAQHTELKTSLDEREKNHQQQIAQFDEQKHALSEQFKVLANDILDTKTKALQENNKSSLSAVMDPFQQSINTFKKEVQDIHHRETVQQGQLSKELAALKELNQAMTNEAHELSTALRGQKKLQGNWGELVLENVLDRSGLQLGKDYKREVSITTEDGRKRPDVVVYLPQNKHLIIDAKVSLNAYTRFVNTDDDVERAQAIKEHVSAVSNRINELADKDYYRLPGLNSPEMVFMFIPIESAFVEALKADEQLFQKAIENNVLVATPTTLLTSLNIVRQLWRYEDKNKHTAALADKAESVFKKLNVFLASFENVKKGLDKATEAYTKAEGQLISGRANLVKQVGDFKKLAPAIKAELPSYFSEKADLEIDYLPVDDEVSKAP